MGGDVRRTKLLAETNAKLNFIISGTALAEKAFDAAKEKMQDAEDNPEAKDGEEEDEVKAVTIGVDQGSFFTYGGSIRPTERSQISCYFYERYPQNFVEQLTPFFLEAENVEKFFASVTTGKVIQICKGESDEKEEAWIEKGVLYLGFDAKRGFGFSCDFTKIIDLLGHEEGKRIKL